MFFVRTCKVLLCALITIFTITACDIDATNSGGNSSTSGLSYFAFHAEDNSQINATVSGQIDGGNVYISIPYNTDITSLVPTINFGGSSISPASGIAQDFTKPVTYTLQVDSSTVLYYTVFVSVALSDSKDITSFVFKNENNNISPEDDYTCQVNGDRITATLPWGTDLSSLVPTISIDGKNVSPLSESPQSFLSPVTYTVTAADGSTKDYIVDIDTEKSDSKEITGFIFKSEDNSNLIANVDGVINGHDIEVNFVNYVDTRNLIPSIGITGLCVNPQTGVSQDFSKPVVYTVTADDGSTAEYTVTVVSPLNPANSIVSFQFDKEKNSKLDETAAAAIVGNQVSIDLPYISFENNSLSLTPDIVLDSDEAVMELVGDPGHDFNEPMEFTYNGTSFDVETLKVTAANGDIKYFSINLSVGKNTSKTIEAFTFTPEENDGIDIVLTGTISGNYIVVKVPYGTNLTGLVPSIDYTGDSVVPNSGVAQDFSDFLTYRVTAEDGSTRDYTVSVVEANLEPKIQSFIFTTDLNYSLNDEAVGIISDDESRIDVTLPAGSSEFWLKPYIVAAADSISPVSGILQDFSAPVIYTAELSDGTQKDYTVYVENALDDDCKIDYFAFQKAYNSQLTKDIIVLNPQDDEIIIEVPVGVDMSNLVPSISYSGKEISPVSGVAQDFTNSVDYVVNSSDAASLSRTYNITVKEEGTPTKQITSFNFLQAENSSCLDEDCSGDIDEDNKMINLNIPYGVDVTTLKPVIELKGFNVSPVSGLEQDFTLPVVYTITATDGSTVDYTAVVNFILPDANTTLSSLKLLGQSDSIDRIENFDSNIISYKIVRDTTTFIVEAVTANSQSIIKINGEIYSSGYSYLVDLDISPSDLIIEVFNADESLSTKYKIVFLASEKLTDLSVKASGEDTNLIENFDPSVYTYDIQFDENNEFVINFGADSTVDVKISDELVLAGDDYNFTCSGSYQKLAINVKSATGSSESKYEINFYQKPKLTSLSVFDTVGTAELITSFNRDTYEYNYDINYLNNSYDIIVGFDSDNFTATINGSSLTAGEVFTYTTGNSSSKESLVIRLASKTNSLFNEYTIVLNKYAQGDFTITSDEDIDAFPAVFKLDGSLTIKSSTIVNINGFANKGIQEITGDFTITQNNNLTSLVGLESLTKLYTLSINWCPKLTDFNGLNNVVTITNILNFRSNAGITSFAGLEKLQSVGGNFYSILNASQVNFTGLSSLTTVGGWFYCEQNSSFINFEGIETLETVGGGFVCGANSIMESYQGLSGLTSIASWFKCFSNDTITDFSGLENLQTTGNVFIILDNQNLQNINNFEFITTLHTLQVNDNPALSTFDLPNLISVYSTIEFQNNSLLPSATIDQFMTQLVSKPAEASIIISGNGD